MASTYPCPDVRWRSLIGPGPRKRCGEKHRPPCGLTGVNMSRVTLLLAALAVIFVVPLSSPVAAQSSEQTIAARQIKRLRSWNSRRPRKGQWWQQGFARAEGRQLQARVERQQLQARVERERLETRVEGQQEQAFECVEEFEASETPGSRGGYQARQQIHAEHDQTGAQAAAARSRLETHLDHKDMLAPARTRTSPSSTNGAAGPSRTPS